jgi:SPP1 gp7 family putative phage head morphogenesis protein
MNTTQKRNRQAKAAGGYITLPPIAKNKVAEVYYRRAITEEMERMLQSMFAEIKRAYTTIPVQNAKLTDAERYTRLRKILERLRRQYGAKLDKNAEKIIKKYMEKASDGVWKSVIKNMRVAYGDGFTINFDKRKYGRVLRARATTNAELIKNTTSQIISNVTNITYDGVTTGQSWTAVEKDLRTQKHIAADRIKRIARDQTAKLNENLNEMSQRDAGIEFFEWMTANDERVSTGYGGHKQLDGKIYKWGDTANYPIIDSYGHRGVPAQRVNCRCTAVPVILRKDYVAKQTSQGDWIITKGRL